MNTLKTIAVEKVIQTSLKSFDAYLRFSPGIILKTRELVDTTAGLYPVYYRKVGNHIKFSTSVVSLILDAGDIEINPDFMPPNYLSNHLIKNIYAETIQLLPKFLKKIIRTAFIQYMKKDMTLENNWHDSSETIDKRIFRLNAFENVSTNGNSFGFKNDSSLNDPYKLVDQTVFYLKAFMQEIEKSYPEYHHVILTGGKDSQLLCLVPKLYPDNWSIFSSEPNYPLVKKWLGINKIEYKHLYYHNNKNEETRQDLIEKIVASDLHCDPRQINFLPTMKKIARVFNNRCIFWSGTAADAIYTYNPSFHAPNIDYFDVHLKRVSHLQGTYHQTFNNFVGCPLLSPYHSECIWTNVYRHYNPSMITPNTDLRPIIGERLYNKPVKWLKHNPTPKPYRYHFSMNTQNVYLAYIGQLLEIHSRNN